MVGNAPYPSASTRFKLLTLIPSLPGYESCRPENRRLVIVVGTIDATSMFVAGSAAPRYFPPLASSAAFPGWELQVIGEVPIKAASTSGVTLSLVTITPDLCSAQLCSVDAVNQDTTTPVSVCDMLSFSSGAASIIALGTAKPGIYAATILAVNAGLLPTTSTKRRDK